MGTVRRAMNEGTDQGGRGRRFEPGGDDIINCVRGGPVWSQRAQKLKARFSGSGERTDSRGGVGGYGVGGTDFVQTPGRTAAFADASMTFANPGHSTFIPTSIGTCSHFLREMPSKYS